MKCSKDPWQKDSVGEIVVCSFPNVWESLKTLKRLNFSVFSQTHLILPNPGKNELPEKWIPRCPETP